MKVNIGWAIKPTNDAYLQIQALFHEGAFCSSWWDAINGPIETIASATENKPCTPNYCMTSRCQCLLQASPFWDNTEQLWQSLLESGLPDADLFYNMTYFLRPALLSSTSWENHLHTEFCFIVSFLKSLILRYFQDPDELSKVLRMCHLIWRVKKVEI